MTVYLDHHATTPVDPRVVESMLPFFSDQFGNPGSIHCYGKAAAAAIDSSCAAIASAIGAEATEIVFTSGATESNNLAIRGVCERSRRRGDHLISNRIEHKAVLDPLERLSRRGYDVTLLDVEPQGSPVAGRLDPGRVAEAISDATVLVSVMLANNEIGIVQPIAEIGRICKDAGVLLHCDATQAVGKIPVDVNALGVDLLSFTAHKLYGPKGIGALDVRRRNPVVRLDPQITGGGQQLGRRSGTLNTPGIVGFAKAVEIAYAELETETERLAELRRRLYEAICSRLSGVTVCGPSLDAVDSAGVRCRLPGNLSLSFSDVDGEALLVSMDDVAVSSGAACTSADPRPSHVLAALGIPADLVRSSLRFGIGRFNTPAEIDYAAHKVTQAVTRLRTEFLGAPGSAGK